MITDSTVKRLTAIALGLLMAATAFALTRHDIDKRNRSESDQYFLMFFARDTGPVGHAFVGWGREDWTKKMSSEVAFGFYPQGTKGVVTGVPGKIVDEIATGSLSAATQLLSVQVNSDVYDKAATIRANWAAKTYTLTETDCITFTAEVAQVAGLTVPDRTTFTLPTKFVTELIKNNP